MKLVRIIIKNTQEVVYTLFSGEIKREDNYIKGNLIGTTKKDAVPKEFIGELILIEREDIDEFILEDESVESPKIYEVNIQDDRIVLSNQLF